MDELIEQLRSKLNNIKNDLEQERELRIQQKQQLNQSKKECYELQTTTAQHKKITGSYKNQLRWYSSRLNTYIKTGTRSLEPNTIQHTGGVCVVCIEKAAIFAHETCGCLTYCRECKDLTEQYKPLRSTWKCPRCRSLNENVIRIFNLPTIKEDEDPDEPCNNFSLTDS